jgi:long-chain acyl-CoA synthetase
MQKSKHTGHCANYLFARIGRKDLQKKVFAEFPTKQLKYGKLFQTIKKIAGLFSSHGIVEGDKIVIYTRNEQYAIELFLASLCCGVCPVIISVDTKKDRAQHIYAHLVPKLIFIDSELQDFILIAKDKTVLLEKVSSNPFRRLNANKETYPALLNHIYDGVCPSELPLNNNAYIVYTSGSTGNPKGVVHTTQSMYAHLKTLCKVFSYDKESTLYNNIALVHADGIIHGVVLAAYAGAKIIRDQPFTLQNLEEQLHSLHRHRVTHFLTLPTVLSWIDKFIASDDCIDYPEFRYLISTAGQLNKDLWLRLNGKLNTFICNVYGLTETVCGAVFAGPDQASAKIGTVGKPVNVQVSVYTEKGELLSFGEGELLISGFSVFSGYYDNPQATADVFFVNDKLWFKSGDIACIDKDGLITITGRKKSVIVSGGRNIHPDEVNEVLLKHPQIVDCYTFACDDDIHAETVACALVVEGEITKASIAKFCLHYLEAYKIPKNIFFLDALPKGPSGKVIADELSAMTIAISAPIPSKTVQLVQDVDILNIAAEAFNVSIDELSITDSMDSVALWDSLGHLSFILAVESKFKIKFTLQEMINIKSLNETKRLVIEKQK